VVAVSFPKTPKPQSIYSIIFYKLNIRFGISNAPLTIDFFIGRHFSGSTLIKNMLFFWKQSRSRNIFAHIFF
jgi:hypothetical protein